MTAFKYWLTTLSVFVFGGATQAYMHPAEARKVTVAQIEAACERALQKNTIEALEDFLHKYPPNKYRSDVACYALALGALNSFGNNDHNNGHDERDHGGGNGGYQQ
jgi:outer membrane protein assembly factor BamD (BamD/ComL family)